MIDHEAGTVKPGNRGFDDAPPHRDGGRPGRNKGDGRVRTEDRPQGGAGMRRARIRYIITLSPRRPVRTMASTHSLAARLSRADAFAAEHGLAWTPLRRQVYERVLAAGRPIGAYDLLTELEPQRGRVPPTTVYRALEFLVEHGFIHRIESKNAFIACCEIGKPHEGQFLICEACGDTVEIPGGDLAKQLSSSPPAHGFEVHRQVVELTGLCGQCKTKHAHHG
ncbi:hypothetical protein BpKM390_07600 [Burkholderia pseudomallei]|nr:hypothetical protein TKS_07610 [Burkholderia pseudomallei]BEH59515.1 hypothetical protein BpKM390_07600 [Burkholderia pseudomallei]